VPTDVEPDFAQFKGDEVLVAGVQRKAEHVVVEIEHALQPAGPKSYADNPSDHVGLPY
jgi:hypothetical protein